MRHIVWGKLCGFIHFNVKSKGEKEGKEKPDVLNGLLVTSLDPGHSQTYRYLEYQRLKELERDTNSLVAIYKQEPLHQKVELPIVKEWPKRFLKNFFSTLSHPI